MISIPQRLTSCAAEADDWRRDRISALTAHAEDQQQTASSLGSRRSELSRQPLIGPVEQETGATHEHAIMNAFDTASSSRANSSHARPGSAGSSGTAGSNKSSSRHKSSRPSSSSSVPPAQSTSSERQQPSNNEVTPIICNGSRDQRNYQSTGGSRDGQTGQKNSEQDVRQGAKNSTNPDPSRAGGDPAQGGTAADSRPPWYKRLADKYGSLELENKGSVARDHLALERTFLAWLRTSLAFASIGIAVTQLFRLNASASSRSISNPSDEISPGFPLLLPTSPYDPADIAALTQGARLRNVGKPLGATFIGVSIVILLIGFHRYFESQYWIVRGKFPASRGSVALVAFVAAALIVASLVVIIAVSPSVTEK